MFAACPFSSDAGVELKADDRVLDNLEKIDLVLDRILCAHVLSSFERIRLPLIGEVGLFDRWLE